LKKFSQLKFWNFSIGIDFLLNSIVIRIWSPVFQSFEIYWDLLYGPTHGLFCGHFFFISFLFVHNEGQCRPVSQPQHWLCETILCFRGFCVCVHVWYCSLISRPQHAMQVVYYLRYAPSTWSILVNVLCTWKKSVFCNLGHYVL
jgi:biotin transporter BioY